MFAPARTLAALRKQTLAARRGGGLFSDAKTRIQTLWGKVPTPLKAAIPIVGGIALSLLGAKLASTMPVASTLSSILGAAAQSVPFASSAARPARDIEAEPWEMVAPVARPPSRFKIVRKGTGFGEPVLDWGHGHAYDPALTPFGHQGGGILASRAPARGHRRY